MTKVRPRNIVHTFAFCNVFHIKKLKNVKRVCTKRIIKGQKEWKGQKMKIYEPQKTKRDHESVQVKIPLLFTFYA